MAQAQRSGQPAKAVEAVTTADQLFEACSLNVTQKFVDAIGKSLYFRELAMGGIDAFLSMGIAEDGTSQVSQKVVLDVLQNSICNEDGQLLFAGDEGRGKLENMSWTKLQPIFTAACECLGMSKSHVEGKKNS